MESVENIKQWMKIEVEAYQVIEKIVKSGGIQEGFMFLWIGLEK